MIEKKILEDTDKGLVVRIRVIPNSSKNELVQESEWIKLKITAQPIENKANKSVCDFFSKALKVPKTSIKIINGELSKEKTLLIPSVTVQKFKECFNLS